jgi:hypothetical protein
MPAVAASPIAHITPASLDSVVASPSDAASINMSALFSAKKTAAAQKVSPAFLSLSFTPY